MAKQYHITPNGEFLYPWLNKPDTTYANAGDAGLFQTKFILSADDAAGMMERIEGAARKALNDHTAEMTSGVAKKWDIMLPFTDEEDDEGEPTGNKIFNFKQNAEIKKKDGEVIKVKIELRDAKDNIIDVNVWGGSMGRIMYTMRPTCIAKDKLIGIRLDFYKVQITKLQQGSSKGFGATDGYDSQEGNSGFGGDHDEGNEGDY